MKKHKCKNMNVELSKRCTHKRKEIKDVIL